jgi:hypothetical protein
LRKQLQQCFLSPKWNLCNANTARHSEFHRSRNEKLAQPVTSDRNAPTPKRLRSEAWLLLGISSLPGELVLSSGTLSYFAHSTGSAWPWQLRKLERRVSNNGLAKAIDEGSQHLVFEWSVDKLQSWCPWYYFDGGIKVKHENLVLRFSFGAPANTQVRARDSGLADVLKEAVASVRDVAAMRRRGKLWQKALSTSEPTASDA